MWSSTPCFKFQYPVFSWRSECRCACLLSRLLVPSVFPSVTYFRWQFLCRMWRIQSAFLYLLYVGCSFLPWLCVILLHFWHNRSNWSSPSFCTTTCQDFQSIFDLCRFQHHEKLCSKCSTLLVSSLNVWPICWWKEFRSCQIPLMPW